MYTSVFGFKILPFEIKDTADNFGKGEQPFGFNTFLMLAVSLWDKSSKALAATDPPNMLAVIPQGYNMRSGETVRCGEAVRWRGSPA